MIYALRKLSFIHIKLRGEGWSVLIGKYARFMDYIYKTVRTWSNFC